MVLQRGNDEPEHRRLKSGPSLMKELDIPKNSPVSVTKLTLGLRVVFIRLHTETKPWSGH